MKKISVLFMLIGSFLNAQIQVGSTTLEEREVVDGLDVPWEIKWGPDSETEQIFYGLLKDQELLVVSMLLMVKNILF